MSAEKYVRIFSQQMEAIVFITIVLFSSWSLWDMTQEHSLNLVLLCLVLFQLSIVRLSQAGTVYTCQVNLNLQCQDGLVR